jgi:hypothetical protein
LLSSFSPGTYRSSTLNYSVTACFHTLLSFVCSFCHGIRYWQQLK